MSTAEEVDPQVLAEVEEMLDGLRREVARIGCTVAGAQQHGDTPGWLHTIGLWPAHRHPELIVVGHPPVTAHSCSPRSPVVSRPEPGTTTSPSCSWAASPSSSAGSTLAISTSTHS